MDGRSAVERRVEPDGDTFVAESVAVLKTLAEPLRLRLLLELDRGPQTVKELARALGVAATRLYYHVNMLERNGVIKVVARRTVSGIEERRYAAVATNWTVSPAAIGDAVRSGLVGALLNVARAELELALRNDPEAPGEPESAVPVLSLTQLFLSHEDVVDVQRRIFSVMEDFSGKPAEPKPLYRALFEIHLTPSELTGIQEGDCAP